MSKLKSINVMLDLYMKKVINDYLDENEVNEIRMYKLRNDWSNFDNKFRKKYIQELGNDDSDLEISGKFWRTFFLSTSTIDYFIDYRRI